MRIIFYTLGILSFLVALPFLVYPYYRMYWYDREYDALRREIGKYPGYRITDHWRHEDLTLEDFGFTVAYGEGEFQIDIIDGTRVRMPSDEFDGLLVNYQGDRIYHICWMGDDYWQSAPLPPIGTVAEFIAHAPSVVEVLRERPPLLTDPSPWPNGKYPKLLRIMIPRLTNKTLSPKTGAEHE